MAVHHNKHADRWIFGTAAVGAALIFLWWIMQRAGAANTVGTSTTPTAAAPIPAQTFNVNFQTQATSPWGGAVNTYVPLYGFVSLGANFSQFKA